MCGLDVLKGRTWKLWRNSLQISVRYGCLEGEDSKEVSEDHLQVSAWSRRLEGQDFEI